jgi:hypothetical protein
MFGVGIGIGVLIGLGVSKAFKIGRRRAIVKRIGVTSYELRQGIASSSYAKARNDDKPYRSADILGN